MSIKYLMMYILLAFMSVASLAHSQDLMGFDRSNYGSVVLSQTQSVGSDVQLELSIGNYENEPIINYSPGSVFAQIGRSVGRLDVLTDKGVFPCTAFIVSEKHILTNYHCSKGLLDNEKIGASRIDATQFVAGYTQTGIEEGTKKYTVIPTPVEASKTLDYAVLEVIGDPSQEYGQLKLASTSPAGGDPFWIIGHPMGEGQRISREKCKANNPALSSGKLLHTCDTLPGNSGSPVIDAGLQQVVALHHAGSKADSVNFAILMSKILANSKVLAAYKAPLSVQQVAPKTAEITACDALYSAAAEAKACYAYDVYIKSCATHTLAPMARGYVEEFCDMAVGAKVSNDNRYSSNLPTCADDTDYFDNCFGIKDDMDSGKYVGEFKDGQSNGQGTFTYAGGDKYVGEFKDGQFNGQGTFTYANGDKFVGGYKDNKKNGQGTYTYANGDKFVGEFKDDQSNGQGTITYGPNSEWAGDKYVGGYKDNKKNGQGTYTFANGDKYVGEFKNNTAHGTGITISKMGQTLFDTKYEDAPSDGLTPNSTVHTVFPYLKKQFMAFPTYKREQIQSNLKRKGFYTSSIDGKWGRGTLTALVEFALSDMGTVDLRSQADSKTLLAAVLR